MKYLFMQVSPEQVIETTTKVTPETMFGYGFAVFVLSVLAYSFYLRAKKAEEVNEKQAKQMLEFGMKLSGQFAINNQVLEMLKQNPETNRDILRMVEENNRKLTEIKEEIKKA